MNLSSRQLLFVLLVVGVGAASYSMVREARDPGLFVLATAAAGVVAALAMASTGQGTDRLVEAVRRVREGERAQAPSGTPPEVLRVYDELGLLADARRRDGEGGERRTRELEELGRLLDDLARRFEEATSAEAVGLEETARLAREASVASQRVAAGVEGLVASADGQGAAVQELSATSDELGEHLVQLFGGVRDAAGAIDELGQTIREVARNIDALSQSAEETSTSMTEMSSSIDEVQRHADRTARLSEEVALDAEKGAEAILKTTDEIFRIKESSEEARAVIQSLGEKIGQIGAIVGVIDDVAEQTNLLALNAAIIAAQAGEQGKGFAVVADEIKELAERAGASTRSINDLIKAVQTESTNAIGAVGRGVDTIDRGVHVSKEAENALKKILSSSRESTEMVRRIARATQEQAKGSKQATLAIERIAETSQQIATSTQQQTRGVEQVLRSTERIRATSQHAERGAQDQSKLGQKLATSIAHCAQLVRELDTAQRAGRDAVKGLGPATSRVDELVREQDAAVRQVRSAADRARRLA